MAIKINELKQLHPGELELKKTELRSELMKLRATTRTGTAPKNTKAIRTAKRTLAKIIMLLNKKRKKPREVEKKV